VEEDIEDKELVTIVQTYDQAEAEFLGAHLDAQGFWVILEEDEDDAVTDDVIEIKVPLEEAKDALACIEPLRGLSKYVIGDESGNVDTGWGECKKCKSRDLTPGIADMGWRHILVFFRLSKTRRVLTCNECGFEWLGDK
jgi:hypothetical protein